LHVLKRWNAWPPGIRWLVGIAAVVLALAIVWALFVPVADWLAHHDVGSVKGSLHETAVDNARGRLLTLGAGLFAAGALVYTAQNFSLSREGQVTDRYTKAIKQIGSKKPNVRFGGIYALERVARDSKRDHPTVMEVLTAFIREPPEEPLPDLGGRPGARSTRPDVQAAVIVVGRREPKRDLRRIDLGGASLIGARLSRANLSRAYLGYADLTNAKFSGADLTGADFTRANLTRANLTRDDPTESDPNPKPTNLTGADLTGAQLDGADLRGAILGGARWPADTPFPEGWELDTGSGRLVEARTRSGPTEAN
jgi:Pentapeptide repeats (8 copies)